MPDIRVLDAIGEIDAADWDLCAGNGDPFVGHAFLSALEESGSVGPEAGWLPRHLVLLDESGAPIATAPLYLKNNSFGEYVFDWGWADAYHRAGGRYYPKLQLAAPFTPVTGRRLLARLDLSPENRRAAQSALLAGLVGLAESLAVSSFHITFMTEDEWLLCGKAGLLLRTDRQFHWLNDGYGSFDDFLAALSSRKRKAIRRERRAVAASGVTIEALVGERIEPRHWRAFYRYYRDTSERKWGQAYLNRDFFTRIGETMADDVLLVMASHNGRPVGGALNLIGGDSLYGRYWGCLENFNFLHFEVCYYRAMEFAIENGLKWVEAGAQGEHKLQRGYLPRPTRSAHWIADPGFRAAVEDFLSRESDAVHGEIDMLASHSPFKRS